MQAGYPEVDELRNRENPGADGVTQYGRPHGVHERECAAHAESKTPGMHRNFTHENRETPLPSAASKAADRREKAMSHKSHRHGSGESYSGIVPVKRSNEGRGGPKEIVEERPLAKENMEEHNPYRTQSREKGPNGLDRVRQAAKENKELKFTALLHHVNVEQLRSSYQSLKKQAAAGVDGVTWEEYGEGLEDRLADLQGRIHRGAYQAKPSRRVWIPKADGRQRPLGIAALEDKIVQHAVGTFSTRSGKRTFWASATDSGQGAASTMRWTRCMSGSRRKVNWVPTAHRPQS